MTDRLVVDLGADGEVKVATVLLSNVPDRAVRVDARPADGFRRWVQPGKRLAVVQDHHLGRDADDQVPREVE